MRFDLIIRLGYLEGVLEELLRVTTRVRTGFLEVGALTIWNLGGRLYYNHNRV